MLYPILRGYHLNLKAKMKDLNKFKNILFKKRTHCVICNEKLSLPLISLPNFPLTEIYVEEKNNEKIGFVDQEFHFCEKCGHGQISNIISPEILYGEEYSTRTSSSSSAIEALNVFLEFINPFLANRKIKTIVDIGCNDLYTLNKLKDKAEMLYGIDPILKNLKLNDEKIKVIGDFIENIDLKKLGDLDVVISSHTLEHIENPKKLIQLLIDNATNETLFFFQFPSLESLVQDARFEQVFHQHLNYFSLRSVIYLLEKAGAELINFKINHYHWGALMIAFKKKIKNTETNKKFEPVNITSNQILEQYSLFKESMEITNKRILSFKNEKVYCYGATPMFSILTYYIPSISELQYILDDDKNKENLYFINSQLKIIHPSIIDFKNSTIIVTGITSKHALRAITSKLIDLKIKNIVIPVNLI